MNETPSYPVPTGAGWLIAAPPALTGLLPRKYDPERPPACQNRPNDHTIFRTDDGVWHLWACIDDCPTKFCLAHWIAPSLTTSPWTFTGELIRPDRNYGESLVVWRNGDFIQSPFYVRDGNRHYLFFGGYATGLDATGMPTAEYGSMENQIAVLLSDDGYAWCRYDNGREQSRVFAGPGAARDPMVLRDDDRWLIYYTGHLDGDPQMECIFVRESQDLLNWSEPDVAHYIDVASLDRPATRHTNESPFVHRHKGWYYLFRSGGLRPDYSVEVLVSRDPTNFGRSGDGTAYRLCGCSFHAPEIVIDETGQCFISKIWDRERGHGIYLERLAFRDEFASES